jgi:hypothetical protein
MPLKGSPYRTLLILLAVALLIIPAAVIFFNDSINLTGTAVRQTIEQESPADEPALNSEESSEGEEPPAGDEQAPADEESQPEGDETNSEGEETSGEDPSAEPTDDRTQAEESDDAGDETGEEPANDDGGEAEATEEASDDSGSQENRDEAEATEQPSAADEQPEATEEPAAEATAEVTPEILPEATAEVTPEVTVLPPVLEVGAVCSAEAGTVFVITNSGGPMPEAQPYALDGEAAGEFQLEEGSTAQIEAGYGSPAFASGELSAALEEACNPPGSISGVVWLDADGDGTRGDEEAAIADVTITLTDSAGGTQETTSTEDGSYEFIHLLPGDYTVQINNPPTDTLPTYDASGEADSSASVTVAFEAVSADFGYQPEPKPAISGVVWADLNGDSIHGDDEPALSDIPVTLQGAETEAQAITDASGAYAFTDLAAGYYNLLIADDVLGEDFILTADAGTITLADTPVEGVDFGLQPARLGSISGAIWLETGDFGTRNSGETGIAGVEIELVDSAGMVLQTATLEAEGTFAFIDLIPGTYTIRIAEASLPDRLFITYNPDGSSAFSTQVTLPPGADVDHIEFGLVGAF